jgi:hypothetical protein
VRTPSNLIGYDVSFDFIAGIVRSLQRLNRPIFLSGYGQGLSLIELLFFLVSFVVNFGVNRFDLNELRIVFGCQLEVASSTRYSKKLCVHFCFILFLRIFYALESSPVGISIAL